MKTKPFFIEETNDISLYILNPIVEAIQCDSQSFFRTIKGHEYCGRNHNIVEWKYNIDGTENKKPYLIDNCECINRIPTAEDLACVHPRAIKDYEINSNQIFNLSEIFLAIQKSPYLPYIFQNYDVASIFVVGSYIMKLEDNHSDLDLCVLIKDDILPEQSHYCLSYKGKKIHWYYYSIHNFYNNYELTNWDALIGSIQTSFLRKECFLYYKEEDAELLTKIFIELKKDLPICIEGLSKIWSLKRNIQDFRDMGKLPPLKYIYHLVVSSLLIQKKDISLYKKELIACKRNNINSASLENQEFCFQQLCLLDKKLKHLSSKQIIKYLNLSNKRLKSLIKSKK